MPPPSSMPENLSVPENSSHVRKHAVSFVSRLCEQEKKIIDTKTIFVTYAS